MEFKLPCAPVVESATVPRDGSASEQVLLGGAVQLGISGWDVSFRTTRQGAAIIDGFADLAEDSRGNPERYRVGPFRCNVGGGVFIPSAHIELLWVDAQGGGLVTQLSTVFVTAYPVRWGQAPRFKPWLVGQTAWAEANGVTDQVTIPEAATHFRVTATQPAGLTGISVSRAVGGAVVDTYAMDSSAIATPQVGGGIWQPVPTIDSTSELQVTPTGAAGAGVVEWGYDLAASLH